MKGLGHETERIGNVRRLVGLLAEGRRWDLVFNIAEGLHGIGREAQVPAVLDAFDIPYTFSDPLVMSLTLHKAMTKRVLRDAGVATSDFWVVEDSGNAQADSLRSALFRQTGGGGNRQGGHAAFHRPVAPRTCRPSARR